MLTRNIVYVYAFFFMIVGVAGAEPRSGIDNRVNEISFTLLSMAQGSHPNSI